MGNGQSKQFYQWKRRGKKSRCGYFAKKEKEITVKVAVSR